MHSWKKLSPTLRVCPQCARRERWTFGQGWMVEFAGMGTCDAAAAAPNLIAAASEAAAAIDGMASAMSAVRLPPQLPPPPATWGEPRRVDQWWWLELNEWSAPGVLKRCGRVSWNADGTGHYRISLSYEDIGLGLSCWPAFHALWAAQGYVETLWALPLEEVEALHGTQWPNVVL